MTTVEDPSSERLEAARLLRLPEEDLRTAYAHLPVEHEEEVRALLGILVEHAGASTYWDASTATGTAELLTRAHDLLLLPASARPERAALLLQRERATTKEARTQAREALESLHVGVVVEVLRDTSLLGPVVPVRVLDPATDPTFTDALAREVAREVRSPSGVGASVPRTTLARHLLEASSNPLLVKARAALESALELEDASRRLELTLELTSLGLVSPRADLAELEALSTEQRGDLLITLVATGASPESRLFYLLPRRTPFETAQIWVDDACADLGWDPSTLLSLVRALRTLGLPPAQGLVSSSQTQVARIVLGVLEVAKPAVLEVIQCYSSALLSPAGSMALAQLRADLPGLSDDPSAAGAVARVLLGSEEPLRPLEVEAARLLGYCLE